MTKQTVILFVLGVIFSILSGCSSCGLKGQCEKVNWYQYGFDLALRGQRIEQDGFVLQCRQADADIQESKLDTGFKAGMAQYCTPETVFQTGKRGESLNLEFCDPGQAAALKNKHAKGLAEFCAPEAALAFGLAGSEYKQNCPAELEKEFLLSYKKGRKKYLESELESVSQELHSVERKADNKRFLVSQSNGALLMLPSPQKKQITKYDPVTKQNVESWETLDPFASQRESLQKQLSQDRDELKSFEAKQKSLHERKDFLRRELIKVSE